MALVTKSSAVMPTVTPSGMSEFSTRRRDAIVLPTPPEPNSYGGESDQPMSETSVSAYHARQRASKPYLPALHASGANDAERAACAALTAFVL